ncbi:hypothetical protein IW140_002377 [Coemansia sp. RSA 1813]|nr:hypothetical protein EV178_002039 [Coemansia sp. RSA 1646]KAJ1771850.1 hypothetical protein LPJ74_002024 [Coemansia sp. RSA 1843]KAJ2090814.1 hypothetical protein IW138_002432 [Coemansia sp. RSA 986]KAJ2216061.1 hypothetical protein EV179_001712 [Coemansia sp. RSA 487]KAJ2570477.1 hypothetical protein IW140_002377 [Coemansia sp. RSA 1813]
MGSTAHNTPGELQQTEQHKHSLEDPHGFWIKHALDLVDWDKKPTIAIDNPGEGKMHRALWFPDGRLNVCYNAVDRHVLSGRGDQVALIYDSPVSDTVKSFTYSELLREVKAFASVLRRHGVLSGDTVLLYMAMVPQTLVAMLACARLGAIHSVVFGGFAPAELGKRIQDCKPRVILSNTCGLESKTKIVPYKPLLDEAIALAGYKPQSTIILQREQLRVPLDEEKGEYYWDTEIARAAHEADGIDCETVESNHPLYMLYTSGTTGMPKGIVRPSGPHVVALLYAQRYMYGLQPGETMFTFSDFGWTLGHSYAAYGPLLNGSKTVLFEGKPVGTPDAGQLYRVFSQHEVRVFLCAPTVVVVLRRADPEGLFRAKYDLTHMRGLFLAGERCTPEIHRWWISTITGRHPPADKPTIACGSEICNVVSDNWWQTESGSPMTGICIGYGDSGSSVAPIKYGSAGLMLPGCDLRVIRVKEDLDEDDGIDDSPEFAEREEVGNIVAKLPLPPGFITTLWKDDQRFHEAYFKRYPGYYDTGDTGMVDSEGYVHILSRTDDVIKVAAHRLSTSSIEEVIFNHPEIAECCVVSRPCALKGRVPMVLAALRFNPPRVPTEQIKKDLVQLARTRVGPIVSLYAENVVFVDRLPKTRSGKILRKMIRMMIDTVSKSRSDSETLFTQDNCPIGTPATIEDIGVKNETWKIILDVVKF